jgi:hypothetical protein
MVERQHGERGPIQLEARFFCWSRVEAGTDSSSVAGDHGALPKATEGVDVSGNPCGWGTAQ